MFNALIVCYLFLGGAGAGALVVLSALELANERLAARGKASSLVAEGNVASQRSPLPSCAEGPFGEPVPQELFTRCWPICFAVLAAGMLCLAFDLGRFDRVLSMFLSPQLSAMAVGAFGLVVALICAGVFSLYAMIDSFGKSKAATWVLGIAGIVAGLVVALYTGALLQSMASVLFWMSPLLPVLFMLSSFSTGIALVFLGIAFVDSRMSPYRAVRWLAKADIVCIAAELACIAAYMLIAYGTPGAQASVEALVTGDLMWYFWLGVVVCGLIVPVMLDWFTSRSNYRMQVLWIAVLVLAGGLLLRVCIVGAGAYDITQNPEALYAMTTGTLGL